MVKNMNWLYGKSRIILLSGLLAYSSLLVAGPPAPVAATGQTTQYAPGDDGAEQAGVAWPKPRFVDNQDGSVSDRLTGLVWLKNANCFGRVSWEDSLLLPQLLVQGSCGLTDGSLAGDWRLPNVLELFGLVDLGEHQPALVAGHPFLNVQLDFYWSGTTLDNVNSPARPVSMSFGNIDQKDKADLYYVWPVRDAR